jgi:bacillithiol system protein YtxJ
MGWFSSTKTTNSQFPWEQLTSISQLDELIDVQDCPVLLFKHSTRCSVSIMALRKFQSEWKVDLNCRLVFLDLLAYRNISNEIASKTGIMHQSPQVIVMNKGIVIYDASHNSISAKKIEQLITQL